MKYSRKKKQPAHHKELTSFYTAQQQKEMESEKLEVEMFHHLKKLRKIHDK